MKRHDYLIQNTSRKDTVPFPLEKVEDTFSFWIAYYLRMVIAGVRSEEVVRKIELHLSRFQSFFAERYGHERISACVKRDVLAFQTFLHQEQGRNPARGLLTAACNNLCKKIGLAHRFVQPEKPCHSLQNQIFITTDAAHGGQGTVGGVCRVSRQQR